MNDQKIYQFLARKPDARAQDVADALDVDLLEASNALRSLVDVGDVVRHAGQARNGQQAQLYNLSLTFKRSDEGKKVIAAVAQPAPAPAVIEVPTFIPAEASTMSRVDRAIAFLTAADGRHVSSEKMREVMGLKSIDSPANYLTSAIKSGRIVKVFDGYKLGTETPPEKPAPRTQRKFSIAPPKKGGPVAQFDKRAQPGDPDPITKDDVKDLPPAVIEQLSKPAQALGVPTAPLAADPAPATFRCGLWSDGVLELQRNGRSLVELKREEHEQLADFMRRMLGAAEQVAA